MVNVFALNEKLVLKVHSLLSVSEQGVQFPDNLKFIVEDGLEYPEKIFEPTDLREKIVWLSSFYVFNFVVKHCFYDGNNRIAFICLSLFTASNGYETLYNETKVVSVLKEINKRIVEDRVRPAKAFETYKLHMKDTNEYKLVKLLLDLAQLSGKPVYSSVDDIVPVISGLLSEKQNTGDFNPKKLVFSFINKLFGNN